MLLNTRCFVLKYKETFDCFTSYSSPQIFNTKCREKVSYVMNPEPALILTPLTRHSHFFLQNHSCNRSNNAICKASWTCRSSLKNSHSVGAEIWPLLQASQFLLQGRADCAQISILVLTFLLQFVQLPHTLFWYKLNLTVFFVSFPWEFYSRSSFCRYYIIEVMSCLIQRLKLWNHLHCCIPPEKYSVFMALWKQQGGTKIVWWFVFKC